MDFPDIGLLIRFDLFIMDDRPPFLQQGIECSLVFTDVVKKNMQREIILIFRIDSVRYVPGPFTTPSLIHHGECLFYFRTIQTLAALVNHTYNTTHIITVKNEPVM